MLNNDGCIEYTNNEMLLIRKQLISMLDEVDRICTLNGIKYSLFYGTMLGAIRDKGFIPWDDDVDIVFTQEEYKKFLDVCKVDLDNRFFLQTTQTDKFYMIPNITKIRMNNTLMVEKETQKMKCHQGIWLDIFVLHYYDNTIRFDKLWAFYRSLYVNKMGYNTPYKLLNIKGVLYSLCLKLLPVSKKRAIYLFESFYKSNKESEYLFDPFVYSKKYIFNKKLIENYTRVLFEGKTYMCFSDYDKLLTQIYGNYMVYPPLEERKSNHNIVMLKV